MFEILYAGFWMVVGAALVHLYHNANFKKALAEELAKAKESTMGVRAEIKKRL